MDCKLVGTLGERFAMGVLYSEGWTLLERNYRCKAGEIDLVVEAEDGTICFVEVKTRLQRRLGCGAESVDKQKQMRIRNAASWFLCEHRLGGRPVKFMVFELHGREIYDTFC